MEHKLETTSRACAICGEQHSRMRPNGYFQSYCSRCHANFMNRTRPKYSELPATERAKHNARAYARVYERRGKLERQPCAKCGSEDSQRHHEDYSKPLDVVWLCRACHIAHHKNAIELFDQLDQGSPLYRKERGR